MINHSNYFLTIVLISVFISGIRMYGQKSSQPETPQEYQFTIEKSIPATSVKNQYRTNTCWSFASVSFIESELLRKGMGEYDLSEMFFVRQVYMDKADQYIRMHGKNNFAEGGLILDVMNTWKKVGMVPQSAYNGLCIGDSLPVHGEMIAVLTGYLNQVIQNPNGKLTPVWKKGFEGILDAYLGPEPAEFKYKDKSYTPRSFADGLELDPDDYIAIGSFTHHPFYNDFILEVPDNWNWRTIKNVPLNEMMKVLDHALEKDYTVCWDMDNSEEGFDRRLGVAIIPDLSNARKERMITQEIRQEGFDNYQTTDDHLMHITGLARDQDGNRFYLVKNSWGSKDRKHDGYVYASESYVRAKTIFLMVHKDAVPASVAEKIGL